MPAVLEKSVAEAASEISRNKSVVQTTPLKSRDRKVTKREPTTLLRKIFQGHEEYLGWTPE